MVLKNKIYHADCFDIMPDIPNASIDLIFTDMPYGTTRNEWDVAPPLEKLWETYERIIKPNGAIVLFAQSPFDKRLAVSNERLYRYEWIWEKSDAGGFLNAKRMPMKAHENLLVFYKKLPTYNPIMTEGCHKVSRKESQDKCIQSSNYGKHYYRSDYCSSMRYPRSVLRFSTDKQKNRLHPTQKPVSLCKYIVETYTNSGEVVLDNFAGSGSIPVVCIETQRDYIAIEKNLAIYQICKKRIEGVYERIS